MLKKKKVESNSFEGTTRPDKKKLNLWIQSVLLDSHFLFVSLAQFEIKTAKKCQCCVISSCGLIQWALPMGCWFKPQPRLQDTSLEIFRTVSVVEGVSSVKPFIQWNVHYQTANWRLLSQAAAVYSEYNKSCC